MGTNFIDLLTVRKADYMTRAQAMLDTAATAGRPLTADEKLEHDALLTDLEAVSVRLGELNELNTRRIEAWSHNPATPPTTTAAASWDVNVRAMGESDAISAARHALDDIQRRNTAVPAAGLERVTDVLLNGNGAEPGRIARWAITAANPAYETAFAKVLRDPTRGHLEWNSNEQAAYSAVADLTRAMSLTGANGGYMVPFALDPSIMLTNDGSSNPLRRLATVKLTTSDTWHGITSAGATAEWKAEAVEVADGSPTIAQPAIPTFFGDSFVPYSFEYGMDAADALAELSRVLVDAADNLMATAYTTGNGTTAPQGIVTGLAGTASEINTTGSEAIDASDPYALQAALPARFSPNASWQSHIAIANGYRQMETTGGALKFPELRDNPARLLGKPWYENSNMDATINAAATASNYVTIYGDVAAGYFIVDRIGATLELIPNLMGANGRPTGQRGALLWFRTGGKVVVPQALRLLDVPTTA